MRAISDGDNRSEIARRMGVSQATVSRWFTAGSVPDPSTVATFARTYGRPVLEAFVAAGLLTADEAGRPPSAELDFMQPPRPAGMSEDEYLTLMEQAMAYMRYLMAQQHG